MKTRIGLTQILLTMLIAAVVSVGWSQSSSGQSGQIARAWEYKSLMLNTSTAGMTEDGQPRPGTPRLRIQELGQQGWELVGMTSANSEAFYYWLKRPR